MKTLYILFLLFLSQSSFGQFQLKKLDKSSIPANINYVGEIVDAARWKDKTGDNLVILTTSDKLPDADNTEEDNRSGALYVFHYLLSGESNKQTWKVFDYIKDCPLDMTLNFVDKTFAVTDLNNDGKAEVWIMYKVTCQGDVSPVPMKIIMYEDSKKFAIRGTTKVGISETETEGGDYVFDEAFKTAPASFREYADKLWQKQKNEN